jgi:hypothetical protein
MKSKVEVRFWLEAKSLSVRAGIYEEKSISYIMISNFRRADRGAERSVEHPVSWGNFSRKALIEKLISSVLPLIQFCLVYA